MLENLFQIYHREQHIYKIFLKEIHTGIGTMSMIQKYI